MYLQPILPPYFTSSSNSSNSTDCYDITSKVQYCFSQDDGSSYCIQSIPIIPFCIIAGIIGWTCGLSLLAILKTSTRWVYSMVFCMFGVMMPTAMMIHCFLPQPAKDSELWYIIVYFILTLIDLGLTSSISVGFAWAGIGDLKLLDPSRPLYVFSVLGSIVGVFLAYLACMLTGAWGIAMAVLYTGIIVVAGLIFSVTQTVLLIKTKQCNGSVIVNYSLSIVSSVLGVLSYTVLCNGLYLFFSTVTGSPTIGAWLGGQTWWYVFSDVAMFYLFLYIANSRKARVRFEILDKKMKEELEVVINDECLQKQKSKNQAAENSSQPAQPQPTIEQRTTGSINYGVEGYGYGAVSAPSAQQLHLTSEVPVSYYQQHSVYQNIV